MRGKEGQPQESVITSITHSYLQEQLGQLEEQQRQFYEAREGRDQMGSFNGSAATEGDWQQTLARIVRIKIILANARVLPSQNDTSCVQIGNRVILHFKDEEEPVERIIGTSLDANYGPNGKTPWIAQDSPLGKHLQGTKEGEEVIYVPQPGFAPVTVKVLQILPQK